MFWVSLRHSIFSPKVLKKASLVSYSSFSYNPRWGRTALYERVKGYYWGFKNLEQNKRKMSWSLSKLIFALYIVIYFLFSIFLLFSLIILFIYSFIMELGLTHSLHFWKAGFGRKPFYFIVCVCVCLSPGLPKRRTSAFFSFFENILFRITLRI